MNNITEILIKAKALIADPNYWTKGTYFRDRKDNECGINMACKFCSIGAVHKVAPYCLGNGALTALANSINGPEPLYLYNDTHTHAEVMAVWDKAIEESKK